MRIWFHVSSWASLVASAFFQCSVDVQARVLSGARVFSATFVSLSAPFNTLSVCQQCMHRGLHTCIVVYTLACCMCLLHA